MLTPFGNCGNLVLTDGNKVLPKEEGEELNGLKLKMKRMEKGLTQQQLAEKLGLHRQYITAIEKGRRKPSVATLERIANELDCSVKDFF